MTGAPRPRRPETGEGGRLDRVINAETVIVRRARAYPRPVDRAPGAGAEHSDATPRASEFADIDTVLEAGSLTPLFQPIVDLATGEHVAYEALPYGPVGGSLRQPEVMLAAAREAGRLDDLDHLFRVRALESVIVSNLTSPYALFANRDPSGAAADASAAAQLITLRRRGLRPVIGLTERDLSRDPVELLAYADSIRAAGMGIALDVGVDADSLALMPFLMPDIVKLDRGLLHRRPDAATVEVLSAVRAHAERRGAVILAEGIETPEHERLALAMGATLGEGSHFGRPGSLSPAGSAATPPIPSRPLVLRAPEEELAVASPFAMVTARHPALRAPVDLLTALRRQLENAAQSLRGLVVVLLSSLDGPHISGACAEHGCDCVEQYTAIAGAARFAAVLGVGVSGEVVPGLRGSPLAPEDPVSSEWDLVVVSPHFAAAIIAKERSDAHPEEGRAFDYVLTYDRTLVVDVARTLMTRALPREQPSPEILAAFAAG